MVRILSLATLLIASAITTQAAMFCQCLFGDGSHCCVYSVSNPSRTRQSEIYMLNANLGLGSSDWQPRLPALVH